MADDTQSSEVNDSTVNGSVVTAKEIKDSFNVTNIIHYKLSKKIIIIVAVIVITLIVALFVWRGNSNTIQGTNISGGTVNQVQGNQTINQVSPEMVALAKELGVTQAALSNFFKILKEQNVKPEDYDHTLRTIAERYNNLLKEVANLQSEDPEVKALLTQAEQVLKQGEFDQAEALINQAKSKDLIAAKKMQENANKRLLSAAEAAARNGDLKLTQIKYTEAAGYFQEAAEIVPTEFAEKLAYYLNQAGLALYNVGKYAEAEPLYQRSLAIWEQALGKNHPDVATSLNNLALLYKTQGKYAEAEPLYQRSLAIIEKTLGKDHPNVALCLNNLAALYHTQGKYAEAEPLYQRSLVIREQALGKDHPDVARSLNNLAELYCTQGKYADAEPLHQRSLAIFEKALGKDHPAVATSLNNLAGLYDAQSKYTEAEPLYQRSLVIREQALGKDHPAVATSLNNLAELYQVQGKYAEAESLYQRSLAIMEKALGSEHPDVATSLNNLAALYDTQGKYAEAESLYQRSLAILEQALGKDHSHAKAIKANLEILQAKLNGEQIQVIVKGVLPNSQAEQLGIQADDILTHYGNKPILGVEVFVYERSLKSTTNPSQELKVLRNGKPLIFKLKQGKIGATLEEKILKKSQSEKH